MKNTALFLLLIVLIAGCNCNNSEEQASAKQQIEALNAQREKAFAQKDIDLLLKAYANDAVCMPEYHPPLFNRSAVRHYYLNWFQGMNASSYHTTTTELIELDTNFIESGSFVDTIINSRNDTLYYTGKYIRHWRITEGGKPLIIAEIWGGTQYFDREKFPYAGSGEPLSITPYNAKRPEEQLVVERNKLLGRLVKERKGGEHAELFTEDAVYMPYYMPPLKGMNDIRAYFVEHEKPGDVTIDSLNLVTGRVLTIGDLIMEHGFYGVRWVADAQTSGIVTGKSLNLWKRLPDGRLQMYRQMVNHN